MLAEEEKGRIEERKRLLAAEKELAEWCRGMAVLALAHKRGDLTDVADELSLALDHAHAATYLLANAARRISASQGHRT